MSEDGRVGGAQNIIDALIIQQLCPEIFNRFSSALGVVVKCFRAVHHACILASTHKRVIHYSALAAFHVLNITV